MAKDEYMFVNDDWLPEGILERIKNLGCVVKEVGEPMHFLGQPQPFTVQLKSRLNWLQKWLVNIT